MRTFSLCFLVPGVEFRCLPFGEWRRPQEVREILGQGHYSKRFLDKTNSILGGNCFSVIADV